MSNDRHHQINKSKIMTEHIYDEIPLLTTNNPFYHEASAHPTVPKLISIKVKPKPVKVTIKVRDNSITQECNKIIKDSLIECFEKMSKYKPYYKFTSMLRSSITDTLKNTDITDEIYNTKWGTLCFSMVRKQSERKEVVIDALNRIGIDIKDLLTDGANDKTRRYVLAIDTEGLDNFPGYAEIMRKIGDEFAAGSWDGVNEIEVSDAIVPVTDDINFLAKCILWIKHHEEQRSMYKTYFKMAKDIFKPASTIGTFPRVFGYNLNTIYWKDTISGYPFYKKVIAYLSKEQVLQFELIMNKIWKELDEQRRMVLLDRYDYTEEPYDYD
jgi:hypothetical protein